MNRILIEQIFDRVSTELPEFKKVALFNDDFNKQNEGEKAGLNFPALFVSFPNSVRYQDGGSGLQRTDEFIVRFLIGEKFLKDKNIFDIFDLKQRVYRVFNGWKPTNASTFRRYAEQTDESRGGFYVFEQDFITKLIDQETYITNNRVLHTITDLNVDGDLEIDPKTVDGIRTKQ